MNRRPRTPRRRWAAVLAAAMLPASSAPAGAGPLVEILKGRQARIDAILARFPKELPPAERKSLEDALAGAIDFGEMARGALAAEWEKRSPAERAEYSRAFEGLIRASLMRRVDIYRIEGVDYGAEESQGGRGKVETVVRSKEATTEVHWDFVRTTAGWRISDYAIDGVSTVRNYRTQFARILARSGWTGLLERIRRRAAEIEEKE